MKHVDVNGDDFLAIYFENVLKIGEFAYCLADCNNDGIVNNMDAELLLNSLMNT